MLARLSYRRYLLTLAVLLAVLWGALAIHPKFRQDWLLENALFLVFVGALALNHRRMPLSRISYALIFLYSCLHLVGAHYTYSEVPYEQWSRALLGRSINELFGLERNHFDRLVHFSHGLLLAYPVRELFLRVADVRGFWGYFLPLDVTMSTSLLYELIEWAGALGFGGDLGAAYLGTQGDQWDAQKDMALASLGALIAMTMTALINLRFRRDFAREWSESLRVKNPAPLGEEELARLRRTGGAPGR